MLSLAATKATLIATAARYNLTATVEEAEVGLDVFIDVSTFSDPQEGYAVLAGMQAILREQATHVELYTFPLEV